MPLEDLFGERDRAMSFGTIAQRYDRYRSGYPEEMIDDLVATGPRTALDVGCGTGKLAAALINQGVEVLGVDPDERMATIARRRGVPVEIATFEEWDDKGRTFDLITRLISTFGDHIRLTADEFNQLTGSLESAIAECGGMVDVLGGTYLVLARRAI